MIMKLHLLFVKKKAETQKKISTNAKSSKHWDWINGKSERDVCRKIIIAKEKSAIHPKNWPKLIRPRVVGNHRHCDSVMDGLIFDMSKRTCLVGPGYADAN